MFLLVSVSATAADTLTVLFGGDVLFDRGVRTVVEEHGYDYVFGDIASTLHKADAAVINLECPLTMRRRRVNKKYIFRADTIAAATMRRAGITHAAMANNHSMDQGLLGLSDTRECLRRNGITPIGYATNSDSLLLPTIISAHGVDVAVFNAVTVPIENWFTTPSDDKPAICYTSIDKLAAAVGRYHAAHPAVPVVVFIHWGQEFRDSPTLQQRLAAAALTRAGTTAIIGQHPHVLQTHEVMGTTPVWYSIGNFVFDQHPEKCNKAQLIMLRFTAEGLADYTALPIDIVNCRPRVSRSQD
ncbi:MAG: CapA family protein [Bacteroidaceae bacterium]|nr:CapA family protein [Bacteroidaceae bacterium]